MAHQLGVFVVIMENHPIPQDVTGFKFKLIGSITVKQFLYILGGGIVAAVCFILPITPFIKIPLSILFGSFGVMLAFIPIEGRPMDVMAKNFLKALPAENQYIYKKRGAEVIISEFFSPQTQSAAKIEVKKTENNSALTSKRALLYGALKKSYRPDEREQAMLSNINTYLNESQHSVSPQVQKVDSIPEETQRSTQIAQPSPIPQANISDAIKVVSPTSTLPKETPVSKPSPSVQETDSRPVFEGGKPEELKMETVAPQQQPVVSQPQQQAVPQVPQDLKVLQSEEAKIPTVNPNESQNVTTLSAKASLKGGFPSLPDIPNVVLGIIKDPRGRILPNILVEIMDPQGIPVRAFKTNALGQFAAATPLPDGEYNVLLEDPRKQHEFEQIHITLDGSLFEPLEIISVDQREKLRRELFEGSSPQAVSQA